MLAAEQLSHLHRSAEEVLGELNDGSRLITV
jgi:hypothetical protein